MFSPHPDDSKDVLSYLVEPVTLLAEVVTPVVVEGARVEEGMEGGVGKEVQ
jgi:hypothetical protein